MNDPTQPNTPNPSPRYDERNRLLCTARSKRTHELCRGPAILGSNVCRMHGGAAPQTARKAKLRLLELVDPAIATLAKEMTQADASGDRQKAANSILDRAGWGRVQKVETTDARDLLFQRLIQIRDEAIAADEYEILTPLKELSNE